MAKPDRSNLVFDLDTQSIRRQTEIPALEQHIGHFTAYERIFSVRNESGLNVLLPQTRYPEIEAYASDEFLLSRHDDRVFAWGGIPKMALNSEFGIESLLIRKPKPTLNEDVNEALSVRLLKVTREDIEFINRVTKKKQVKKAVSVSLDDIP